LANFLDIADVAREDTRKIVLGRIRRAHALARSRITSDSIAFVQRRKRTILQRTDALTNLADTVDLARVRRGTRIPIAHGCGGATLRVLVTNDGLASNRLDAAVVFASTDANTVVACVADGAKLVIVARCS
jgi:hypothetical protein